MIDLFHAQSPIVEAIWASDYDSRAAVLSGRKDHMRLSQSPEASFEEGNLHCSSPSVGGGGGWLPRINVVERCLPGRPVNAMGVLAATFGFGTASEEQEVSKWAFTIRWRRRNGCRGIKGFL